MNAAHNTVSGVARPAHLRLVSLREPDTDAEQVSPELALIDDALRHRLLDDLYEPGAFRHHQRLTNRVTQVVGVFPHTAPTVHPSGGVATGSRVAFVHRMPASMWSLPSVIALAVAIGFAAGYIGYRTQITAPTPSETGAPPPTVEAASRTTPKAASPGKIAAPLVPQRAATSAEGAGRTFAWVAATGVHAYEVQFFRGDKRVLSRRVKAPRLVLPRRWTTLGGTRPCVRATYRWYVWSIRGEPPQPRREACCTGFVRDRSTRLTSPTELSSSAACQRAQRTKRPLFPGNSLLPSIVPGRMSRRAAYHPSDNRTGDVPGNGGERLVFRPCARTCGDRRRHRASTKLASIRASSQRAIVPHEGDQIHMRRYRHHVVDASQTLAARLLQAKPGRGCREAPAREPRATGAAANVADRPPHFPI